MKFTKSSIQEILMQLDTANIHYSLHRYYNDTVTIVATAIRERVEIDVFENEDIECSFFTGSEKVKSGFGEVSKFIERHKRLSLMSAIGRKRTYRSKI
jgi:ribosomal protein L31